MSVIKCKMCGGDLELIEGSSVAVCEYCGSQQTVPAADNEKKLTLFARANRLRLACEFDKAAGVYESIVADFPTEAEAYWGLVLCRYGIEYVDDPATGKKIPTCHRSSFDSVMEDSDFEQALENADAVARRVYRDEAKAIEELRRGIVEVSGKEPPYDIFICYKETAEDGQRTVDSVIAQDVYDALTEKGYRVFFSRISLEDKLGTEYEPYIFAALHSAKIMLAFGTDYEYYNAVWVKNEWSRYLQLMTKDKSKHLIPCYKGIDAYDMPKEFAKLQAQDMGKVGAMQDLLRGVDKIMGRDKAVSAPTVTGAAATSATVESLLKRAEMFLEDGDWNSADEYCEKVLDITPENAQAYLYKLMVELKVRRIDELQECELPFDDRDNYHKVMRFGDERLKAQLTAAIGYIKTRLEDERKDAIYEEAHSKMGGEDASTYSEALALFQSIPEWKDAEEQVEICQRRIKEIQTYERNLQIEKDRQNAVARAKRKRTVIIFTCALLVAVVLICVYTALIKPAMTYKKATSALAAGNYNEAYYAFASIKGYKDSAELFDNFRIAQKETDNGEATFYEYDKYGNLVRQLYKKYDKTESDTKISYQYSPEGVIISSKATKNGEIWRTEQYNDKGQLASQTFPETAHTKEYNYDESGKLVSVSSNILDTEEYTYDSKGNLIKISRGNRQKGETRSYTYDKNNFCISETSLSWLYSGRELINSFHVNYEYSNDIAGNVLTTRKSGDIDGECQYSYEFTYVG